jgi:hypothetical protein
MRKYYLQVRSLHLYFGLFISPFVLIFALSVLVFNHPQVINEAFPVEELPVVKQKLDAIPYDTTDLLTARAIINEVGIKGEVDYINQNADRISFPVRQPGIRRQITVNKLTDSVYIREFREGSVRALTYLHSMPGPHNQKIRGNSGSLKIWRVFADIVVYVLLFISASGVFLWYFLRVERNPGLFALAFGAVVFAVLLLVTFSV